MERTDFREWRVPLPVSMRISVCFRMEQVASGWRTGQLVSGRDLQWEIPIDETSPVSASPTEAIEIEYHRLQENLQAAAINTLHRHRLIEKIEEFMKELRLELANIRENAASVAPRRDEFDIPQKKQERIRKIVRETPVQEKRAVSVVGARAKAPKAPLRRVKAARAWRLLQLLQRRPRRSLVS